MQAKTLREAVPLSSGKNCTVHLLKVDMKWLRRAMVIDLFSGQVKKSYHGCPCEAGWRWLQPREQLGLSEFSWVLTNCRWASHRLRVVQSFKLFLCLGFILLMRLRLSRSALRHPDPLNHRSQFLKERRGCRAQPRRAQWHSVNQVLDIQVCSSLMWRSLIVFWHYNSLGQI